MACLWQGISEELSNLATCAQKASSHIHSSAETRGRRSRGRTLGRPHVGHLNDRAKTGTFSQL